MTAVALQSILVLSVSQLVNLDSEVANGFSQVIWLLESLFDIYILFVISFFKNADSVNKFLDVLSDVLDFLLDNIAIVFTSRTSIFRPRWTR